MNNFCIRPWKPCCLFSDSYRRVCVAQSERDVLAQNAEWSDAVYKINNMGGGIFGISETEIENLHKNTNVKLNQSPEQIHFLLTCVRIQDVTFFFFFKYRYPLNICQNRHFLRCFYQLQGGFNKIFQNLECFGCFLTSQRGQRGRNRPVLHVQSTKLMKVWDVCFKLQS